MDIKFRKNAIAFAIVAAMAAGATGQASATSQPIGVLEGGVWMFQSDKGQASKQIPHLLLDKGKATGNDGCNNFMTTYHAKGRQLRINATRVGMTRMLCPNMEATETFMRMLAATRRYKVKMFDLWLMDDKGNVIGHFKSPGN